MFIRIKSQQIRERFILKGQYYGYPQCCIDMFTENIIFLKKHSKEQLKASKGTGFIPCLNHTNDINSGKLTLQELIKNRKCVLKFPNDR